MATKADIVIVELVKVLEGIASPKLRVRQAAADLLAAKDGDCFVLPVERSHDDTAYGKRRMHLELIVAVRTKIIAPTASSSACAGIFAAEDVIFDALGAATAFGAGGIAAVEQLRRGKSEYWYRPEAELAAPAGFFLPVYVDWLE